MLPPKIKSHLNNSGSVAAELPSAVPGTRCFVRIRAIAKPGVPREEFRYLNSKYSMWEYWNFEFRRMVLRTGWESDEWNYDRYLVEDAYLCTWTEAGFFDVLACWVPQPECLRHSNESACPE